MKLRCLLTITLLIGQPYFLLAQHLQAAGASFPAPLYESWFSAFQLRYPDVLLTYESAGSSNGLQRVMAGEIDFGGSDIPFGRAGVTKDTTGFLQLASTIGAITPIYNLKDQKISLRLSPVVIAGVFSGKIHKWNDPAIQRDNLGVKLPADPITVVHRVDGSGSTFIFSQYLSSIPGTSWKGGVGTTVRWPNGSQEAYGNEGVAKTVAATPGAIGYVEYLFALQNECQYASVKNAFGRFVDANVDSIAAAVPDEDDLPVGPDELSVSLSTSKNPQAYPISSFTWLVVPLQSPDAASHKAKGVFLRWMLTSGQLLSTGLGYAPLPQRLVNRELAEVNRVFPPTEPPDANLTLVWSPKCERRTHYALLSCPS